MYFLGLDYSTQKLKAIIFDNNAKLIVEDSIDYDLDLIHYGTLHGVYKLKDGVVCAPSIMWLEATDLLFKRLSSTINLSEVTAICGSAQQHTTMFWGKGSNHKLSNLDPSVSLSEQLESIFSRSLSPTWMDSSTSKECHLLEESFGGKHKFQSRIGSSLADRFSGPQIMKAFSENKELENHTDHITLVSNGMCSIFAGKIVGIDVCDAAGTGLQKSGSLDWDLEICSFISPYLVSKLGQIMQSNCVVSRLSQYFVDRYKMSSNCKIVSFTGDNPSSVVGMLLNENDLCISLGTSDTLFACLPQLPEIMIDIPVFVFPHPINPDIFVSLLCYKNGSQTRQIVRDQYAEGQWDTFDILLNSSPPGNSGIFGLFYDFEEIIPPGIAGRYFQNSELNSTEILLEQDLDKTTLIRCLIEGQLLSKYHHFSQICSNNVDSFGKLLVTGGASINNSILQIIADIFEKPIMTIDTANSAAMGSVYRSVAATQDILFFTDFVRRLNVLKHICDAENSTIYRTTMPKFVQFLNQAYRQHIEK